MSQKPPQMSEHFPDAFYRVSIKGLCVRDGKVLLCHDCTGRSDIDPSAEWEIPGGGLDFGENMEQAFKRELQEEMKLNMKSMDSKPTYIIPIKRENARRLDWYHILLLMYRFEPENLDFTPSDECREVRFFSQEELKANYADLSAGAKALSEVFDPKDFI